VVSHLRRCAELPWVNLSYWDGAAAQVLLDPVVADAPRGVEGAVEVVGRRQIDQESRSVGQRFANSVLAIDEAAVSDVIASPMRRRR
jgi:hypothetical protein